MQVGANATWTQVADADKIRAHYPNGKLTVYADSAMMPPIEETAKWVAEMRAFLVEKK